MRYTRVHTILKGERALNKQLSQNMAAVCRPDQTFEEFPIEVVKVTDAIHAASLDAYTLSKLEVIRFAHKLLVESNEPAKPAPETYVDASVEAPIEAEIVEPVKQRRTRRKRADADADIPDAPTAEVNVQPTATKTPTVFIRPYIPLIPGIAAINCLYSALQLLEPFVKEDSDARMVCAELELLVDKLHARTLLPNAEKESQQRSS